MTRYETDESKNAALDGEFKKIYGRYPASANERQQFRRNYNRVRFITDDDREVIAGRKKRTRRQFNHAGSN